MRLSELGNVLDRATWLKDQDLPEALTELHPPFQKRKQGEQLRVIVVLPDKESGWSIYLVLEASAANMDNSIFRSILRGKPAAACYQNTRIIDLWYLPGLCIVYGTKTWGVEDRGKAANLSRSGRNKPQIWAEQMSRAEP